MKNDYSEIMMSFPKCDFTEVNNQSPSSMFNHRVRFCDLDIDDLFCYADRLMIKVGAYTAHTAGKRGIDSFMFNLGDLVKVKKDVVESESNLKDVSQSNSNPMPFIEKELLLPTSNSTEQKDITKIRLCIKDNILNIYINDDKECFIQHVINRAHEWCELLPPLLISGQLASNLFIQQKDDVFRVYQYDINHNILVEKNMSGDNWRQGDMVTIIFNSFIHFNGG